jgi:cell division protein FtsB
VVDVTALQRENAAQRAVIERLTMTVDSLTLQLAQLNERVTELLAAAQRRQGGARTTATTSSLQAPPPPPMLDDEA